MPTDDRPCDLPCPKCGSADVMRTWRGKGDDWTVKDYGVTRNRYAFAQAYRAEAQREHIDHHCRCCQYEWQTLPLRKKKGTP